jgi:hypothetical protein
MRAKLLLWTVLVMGVSSLLAAVGPAAAEVPSLFTAGNLQLGIVGGLSPKELPRHRLAPVTLAVDGKLGTVDGTPPPALGRIVLDSDRNAVVNAVGLPACSVRQLTTTTTQQALAACPGAVVGRRPRSRSLSPNSRRSRRSDRSSSSTAASAAARRRSTHTPMSACRHRPRWS